MAFQSNGPVMLALPPFRGFTRRVILIAGCWFLAMWVMLWVWPAGALYALAHVMLNPWSLAHGMVWELVTYPFVGMGLLSVIFALLSVWFFGSRLEDDRGSRWLMEYFLTVTIGGALIATALSYAVARWVLALQPAGVIARGMWPAVTAILVAFAWFYPNEELRLYFVLRVKAKYVALIYVVGYVLLTLFSHDVFGALVGVTNALCGWIFLKFVPRRGLQFAASEKWFAMRNSMIRNKRKRAAKEFEVYMRKQGKDVRVEDENDKKWMN